LFALKAPEGTSSPAPLITRVAIVLFGGFWGLSYSALGFAIALKTGNSQATQSMWVLFMPLMFLTTVFAPMEALSGWLKVAATLNPMTYFLRGMREIATNGWDLSEIGVGLLAVTVLGCVTLSLALLALRSRVA
jgi:ABC-2 type transport system permease protein